MSTVFIIGGAGKVGSRLTKALAQKGHIPRPMYRHPEQESYLMGPGIEPVQGDLLQLSVDNLSELMHASDVVVFTAGAGSKGDVDLTHKIDGDGLSKTILSVKKAGITRLILVSAFPDASRDKPYSASRESYLHIKKLSESELTLSGLDWIILRAGVLNDAEGTGKIRAGQALPYGKITRDDVASTLTELINNPSLSRVIIEVTEGDDPISEALKRIAE